MVVDVEPLDGEPCIGEIIVFRSRQGLVAHRLVAHRVAAARLFGGEIFRRRVHTGSVANRALADEAGASVTCGETGAFVTCGDAYPLREEIVPRHLVIGRVKAVWASAEPNAGRIDDGRYHRLGTLFARTHALRSLLAKVRAYCRLTLALLLDDPKKSSPAPAFATLVAATQKFERREYSLGVALLASLPAATTIEMARRHHMSGYISCWLDEATRAGAAVPSDLADGFRRIRLAHAIQTGRVLACVREVRDRFIATGIPHIFLKGGARLAAGDPGAEVQFSGDVDVIVPPESLTKANAALRAAGFRSVAPRRSAEGRRRMHDRWHHHAEPLMSPTVNVPVEVHVALAPPAVISERLDYSILHSFVRTVPGPIGEVDVLDPLASAIHLAYHARDLHVWRDIVLLSRLLRTFDAAPRTRFDAYIKAERKDGLRLASAVAAADAIACDSAQAAPNVERYLAWAVMREDLANAMRYCDIVEAVVGRCRMPKLQLRPPADLSDLSAWLRCWVRNLISLPSIVRALQLRRFRNGSRHERRFPCEP
jgi:hypothetical protein